MSMIPEIGHKKPSLTFTIIGAGNGGRSFAVYLSRLGYAVNLIYQTYKNIEITKLSRTIYSTSPIPELNGYFKLNDVSKDYSKAINDADVILFVVNADVHSKIAKRIAPYVRDKQIILLNPGRTFGAIEIQNIFQRLRPKIRLYVGETQTLLFTCRKIKDYGVYIGKVKKKVDICFYPEYDNFKIFPIFKKIFPQFYFVNDIMESSLNNMGAMIHPAVTLLNSGSICRDDEFYFYTDGVTKEIADVVEQVDKERLLIMEKLNINSVSILKWLEQVYNVRETNYYDAFHSVPIYKIVLAPQLLRTRYINEDIPTGLVPLVSIAEFLNIKVPTIKSLIQIANLTMGTDYYKTGRTISNLNIDLEHYIDTEIVSFIEYENYLS